MVVQTQSNIVGSRKNRKILVYILKIETVGLDKG